jgi:excisionase family DNA binding protein
VSVEPYVAIEEAARFLAVPVGWLYDAASKGAVPSVKVGKYRRFRISELERWVKGDADPLVQSHGADGNSR